MVPQVERVMSAFKMNPYEILGLDMSPGATDVNEIRKLPHFFCRDQC